MTIILATGVGAAIFLACFHRLMADAEKLEMRHRKAVAQLSKDARPTDQPLIDLDCAI